MARLHDGAPAAPTHVRAPAAVAQWRELFAVPEDLAYSPAMVRAIPQLARALLTVVSAEGVSM